MGTAFFHRVARKGGLIETHGPARHGQTPVKTRASVDLPAALGPITASTLPAFTSSVTALSAVMAVPGTCAVTASMLRDLWGAGSEMGEFGGGRLRARPRGAPRSDGRR